VASKGEALPTLTVVNVGPAWSRMNFGNGAPVARCPGWKIVGEENSMIVDYVLGGIVTAALLIYLLYVLLRPERF
jgi:K+-transporting ATPase KdpF subunit